MKEFAFGRAALAMLLTAVISAVCLLASPSIETVEKYDLTIATFAPEHAAAYGPMLAKFERENHCRVQLQLVDQKALQDRLQSSLQVGADVPDMVELLYGTLGIFTAGRLDDVKLLDLTDRIERDGLKEKVVANRFPRWSSRGRSFALPHDVHPIMLAYRRDLCEQLGIDVSTLTTWDKFCEVGRALKIKRLAGDTVARHYMIDLPYDGSDALRYLLLQHGGNVFDEQGRVTFDSPEAVDVVTWYVAQTRGSNPVAYGAGTGQSFSRAMIDGLCLFYICPDWRTKQLMNDVPSLAGKMALMPMPAWREGGIRTSTWGGAGLAITKGCKNPDLAWKLAMYLYYDVEQIAPRFAETNILPPVKAAWQHRVYDRPSAFYSGQSLGREYANLAESVPKDFDTAYNSQANAKFSEAFANAAAYYEKNGEADLRAFTAAELKRRADQVRRLMDRNLFLREERVEP